MALVLGIDLGTTNSAAAVMEHDGPMVVPLHGGKLTIPSVVAFAGEQRLVGEAAKRQFISNVENTVSAAKRLIGRAYSDPQTQKAIASLSYRCVEGPNGDVWVAIGKRSFAIQEVSALVLAEIKRAARHHFARDIDRAVVTVPAYFNDRQRYATKQAAKIAGLDVLRVVNEPTAAALAYGMHQGAERRVAVYDLGGGTFDVSVLKVGGGAVEVLASAGDAFLGGHDFDDRIFRWLRKRIESRNQVRLDQDRKAIQRLREAAEAAKIRLSDETTTKIALPFLTTDASGNSVHCECELERGVFEELVRDLVDQTVTTFQGTIETAGLRSEEIEEVLLVGGMTAMPAIRARVEEVTQCPPATGVHPDLVVAVGAAVQASLMSQESDAAILLDVTPHDLGLLTVAELSETVIPRNTKVPATVKKRFVTVSDHQPQVRIVVYQGDERHIDRNEILGEFILDGLRLAPAGDVEIDVIFSITVEGIVHVSAIDVETNKKQTIRIEGAMGVAEEELERMIEDHRANPPVPADSPDADLLAPVQSSDPNELPSPVPKEGPGS
jgi:molecular chaperone DnaK